MVRTKQGAPGRTAEALEDQGLWAGPGCGGRDAREPAAYPW